MVTYQPEYISRAERRWKTASRWVLPRREPEPASGGTKEEAESATNAPLWTGGAAAAASESARLAVE